MTFNVKNVIEMQTIAQSVEEIEEIIKTAKGLLTVHVEISNLMME